MLLIRLADYGALGQWQLNAPGAHMVGHAHPNEENKDNRL
jgi:hypothetical protein